MGSSGRAASLLVIYPSGGDDTARIDAAATASLRLHFAPGSFSYSGNGLNPSGRYDTGSGRGSTQINLGAGKSLWTASGAVSAFYASDISVVGGFGAYRGTYTGVSVQHHIVMERIEHLNYTACAVSTMASDQPYWTLRECSFKGVNDTATIGFAHNGDSAGLLIDHCAFEKNRVHIKLAWGGDASFIRNCDFLRFTAYSGIPRTDLWVCPNASATQTNSAGLIVSQNKFGNENLDINDYRVLYAAEGSGTDITDKFPTLAAVATGNIFQHLYTGNLHDGNGVTTPNFITSNTATLYTRVADHMLAGTRPAYIISYTAAAQTAMGVPSVTNIVGPLINAGGVVTACNPAGAASSVTPWT